MELFVSFVALLSVLPYASAWKFVTNDASHLPSNLHDLALNLEHDTATADHEGIHLDSFFTYGIEEDWVQQYIWEYNNGGSQNFTDVNISSTLQRRAPACGAPNCDGGSDARVDSAAQGVRWANALCEFMDNIGTPTLVGAASLQVSGYLCRGGINRCSVTVTFVTNVAAYGVGKVTGPICQQIVANEREFCLGVGGTISCQVPGQNDRVAPITTTVTVSYAEGPPPCPTRFGHPSVCDEIDIG